MDMWISKECDETCDSNSKNLPATTVLEFFLPHNIIALIYLLLQQQSTFKKLATNILFTSFDIKLRALLTMWFNKKKKI